MAIRFVRAVTLLLGLWLVSGHCYAQNVEYSYNSKGQVATATYYNGPNFNGTTVTFSYDLAGNRVSAVVATDTTPPSSPGTPAASNVTGTSATLTWTQATDTLAITGYAYRVNGGPWSSFANVTSVNLSSLTPGGTYTVDVEAQDAGGNITQTPSTYTFTMPPTAPGTPTFTNITGNSVTVSWTAASDSLGVAGYRYQLNGGAWSAFSNVLSVNLTGLPYGGPDTISVEAEDPSGNIGPASSATFSTGPTTPGAPTASSVTGTSATLSWTPSSDPYGVTGYSYQVNGGSWSAFTNVLSVSLTGLTYGTTYTIGVRAQDNVGNISFTASGSFSTLPSAPGIPTASNIAGTSATVSWSAASDNNGVTGYSYQLNGSSWSAYSNVGSVNLTGLTYGASYTVNVRAQDSVGNVGPASTGSFTTPPSSPGVPSFSNIAGTTATVSWSAATDGSGITGYSYQINGSGWSTFSNVLSVNLSGLVYGTTYVIGVRAEDAYNNIGSTATGSFTTTPSAPGTPTFSNIGGSSATATWGAATSAVGVSGYRYSLNGGASWTNTGMTLSASLSGLATGTLYTVLVEAQGPSGAWGGYNSGSFTTLAYYSDTFTFTSGSSPIYQQTPYGLIQIGVNYGYQPGVRGALSPTQTANGHTIAGFYGTAAGGSASVLSVSGFSSDPGVGWLNFVSLTGGSSYTITGASAVGYSYSSGTATWTWTGNYASYSGSLTISHK